MKIGILGANGFIGQKLVEILNNNHKIISITRENYNKHLEEHFDIFINANGNSRKYWANQNPKEDFEASVNSVCKSIYDFNCEKYIYLSSLDAYKQHSYGVHKKLAEELLKNTDKCISIVLRLGAVIGDNLVKGVVYDIMNNKEVYLTANSELQLITTTEIANLIEELIYRDPSDNHVVLDVAGTQVITVENIAKILGKEIKYHEILEEQHYFYNDNSFSRYYPLKTSEEYLKEIYYG